MIDTIARGGTPRARLGRPKSRSVVVLVTLVAGMALCALIPAILVAALVKRRA